MYVSFSLSFLLLGYSDHISVFWSSSQLVVFLRTLRFWHFPPFFNTLARPKYCIHSLLLLAALSLSFLTANKMKSRPSILAGAQGRKNLASYCLVPISRKLNNSWFTKVYQSHINIVGLIYGLKHTIITNDVNNELIVCFSDGLNITGLLNRKQVKVHCSDMHHPDPHSILWC